MFYVNDQEFPSPIKVTLDIFNDRWKLLIISCLVKEDKRFKDIHMEISDITQKTLPVKLKELEEKNIINRKVFPEVPPKVVYSLTSAGKKLKPVLDQIDCWVFDYVNEYGEITKDDMCHA